MPAPLRRSPLFRCGVGGDGTTANDGHPEHYPTTQSQSARSIRADGNGCAFLAINKNLLWDEAFRYWSVTGQTLDASSVALEGCKVEAFKTGSDEYLGDTTSGGGGNYAFNFNTNSFPLYLVAYKAGSPDVAGTTVNTLTAT